MSLGFDDKLGNNPVSPSLLMKGLFYIDFIHKNLVFRFFVDDKYIYRVSILEASHASCDIVAENISGLIGNQRSSRLDIIRDNADSGSIKDIAARIKNSLDLYFAGKGGFFNLPIAPEGTVFQKTVWEAMLRIPYGTVISYKELAESAGFPSAARAAAGACRDNPIPLIIPCHRVISSDGTIGGYSGKEKRTDIKRTLLGIEGVII